MTISSRSNEQRTEVPEAVVPLSRGQKVAIYREYCN